MATILFQSTWMQFSKGLKVIKYKGTFLANQVFSKIKPICLTIVDTVYIQLKSNPYLRLRLVC